MNTPSILDTHPSCVCGIEYVVTVCSYNVCTCMDVIYTGAWVMLN